MVAGTNIAAMAFADDIILLEDRQDKLQAILFDTTTFCERRGLAINPFKCTSLSGAPTGGNKITTFFTKPIFTVGSKRLPIVDSFNTFRYLGYLFGTSRVHKPTAAHLSTWCSRLQHAPLKPDQKLNIISDNVLPKALYGLQNLKFTAQILKTADRIVNGFVKKALRLPIHTPDALVQAKLRDGGLGIPELRREIPSILTRRIENLSIRTTDPTVLRILNCPHVLNNLNRLKKLAGITPAAQIWRENIISGPSSTGIEQVVEDKSSRQWIANKTYCQS